MNPEIKRALNALRATLAEASGFDPGTSQRRIGIGVGVGVGCGNIALLQAGSPSTGGAPSASSSRGPLTRTGNGAIAGPAHRS
jgi:hypothetical protein